MKEEVGVARATKAVMAAEATAEEEAEVAAEKAKVRGITVGCTSPTNALRDAVTTTSTGTACIILVLSKMPMKCILTLPPFLVP
jgi:hypothetical protein